MGILARVRQQFRHDQSGVKRVTGIDVRVTIVLERDFHLSVWAKRRDNPGNLLQEIAEVYAISVAIRRQQFVESRRDLDASADLIQQCANLIARKGFAAAGDCASLKANNAAQAREVVGDPVIGLGQLDYPMVNRNRHFASSTQKMRRERSANKKIIVSSIR